MRLPKDTSNELALRRAVKEVIFLSVIFLTALGLFVGTLHFIAAREADHDLHNPTVGITIGLANDHHSRSHSGTHPTRGGRGTATQVTRRCSRITPSRYVAALFRRACLRFLFCLYVKGIDCAATVEYFDWVVRLPDVHRILCKNECPSSESFGTNSSY